MSAQQTIDRAIALIETGENGQAIEALAAAGRDVLNHAASAVEICLRAGTKDAGIALLRAVRQNVDQTTDTLVLIALELVALGHQGEALDRLCEAGRLYAELGHAKGFDRIAEIVGTMMDAGMTLSHRRLHQLHGLDRWNAERWGRWFATCFLRQAGKMAAGQADASTLQWLDEVTEDAITANKDETAVRAWLATHGGSSVVRPTPMRDTARGPGVSTMLRGRTLGELYGVFGDVESVTFTETPGGIHRRINLRKKGAYALIQRNYLDQSGWPIPNTEVMCAGAPIMRLNSLGARGLEPDGATLCFVGASETFGEQVATSWPELVRIPGIQPLNGAVEGYSMERILARYEYLKAQPIDYVGFAVFAGWHNLIYNENTQAYWDASLTKFLHDRLPIAFINIAAALTEECRTRGVDELMARGDFNFWGNLEPTREKIGAILDKIAEWNAFLERFCRRSGAILVDLHTVMAPKRYEEIPIDFMDVNHFRPATYPRVAQIVAEALTDPMGRSTAVSTPEPARAAPPPAARKATNDDASKYLYPLW
jgi:hypothetical protein